MRDFLSSEVRIELEFSYDEEHDRRVCDRIKAIFLVDEGWDYEHIARVLRISEGSVGRFVKEYLARYKLKPENGGSQSELNESQTFEIKADLSHMTCMIELQALPKPFSCTIDDCAWAFLKKMEKETYDLVA